MALEGNYGWLSKDPEVSGSPDRLFLSSRDSIFARKYIARDERSEKVQIVRSKLLTRDRVDPACRSLLCRFNLLYLVRNLFSWGPAPKPPGLAALDLRMLILFSARNLLSWGPAPIPPSLRRSIS